MNAPRVVAAFDFDGTLTRRDTLVPFLARSLGWPRFLLALLKSSPWLAGYALQLVPNDVAKARLLRYALAGRSLAEVDDWAARWLADHLPHQLQAWTMERLRWHQQAGHCCVMVSASPDVYLTGAAASLGFDGLVCTQLEVLHGRLTGEMQTPNCHGEQKVLRLNAWLTDRFDTAATDSFTLHAYGDSKGDKPMLRMAVHAWYRGKPWKH